jgi:hypothetical protein
MATSPGPSFETPRKGALLRMRVVVMVGTLRFAHPTEFQLCFSATLELQINRSRGRGLRNRANYGLSRDEIVVL